MPTTLPRTQVTMTEPLQRALAVGRKYWPALSQAGVISRLATIGAETIRENDGLGITPFEVRSEQIITTEMVSDALANTP